jgi:hypothetical protein
MPIVCKDKLFQHQESQAFSIRARRLKLGVMATLVGEAGASEKVGLRFHPLLLSTSPAF